MREPVPKTILELLQHGRADADAIAATGQRPLSYGELRPHAGKTVTVLNSLGIGRNDRVAIVLPNGPDMGIGVRRHRGRRDDRTAEPAYRQEEFEFYLTDLQAKVLVVEAGSETVARKAAAKLGIAILELHPTTRSGAGLFTLSGDSLGTRPSTGGNAESNDVALVLHTSGTTSRPKLVRLSQINICASAANMVRSLSLVPEDRCLNVMPLFHIHGLSRGGPRFAGGGGLGLLHVRVQRAVVLCLDEGSPPDVVYRGADHAPGDPRACPA